MGWDLGTKRRPVAAIGTSDQFRKRVCLAGLPFLRRCCLTFEQLQWGCAVPCVCVGARGGRGGAHGGRGRGVGQGIGNRSLPLKTFVDGS